MGAGAWSARWATGRNRGLAERKRRGAATGGGAAPDSRDLARLAARVASEKQAQDIVILDVRETITITDYFVIVSGTSDRHVRTVAEEVSKALKAGGVRPVREEGESSTGWVLLDFVDFVVHVFDEERRDYYRLERLWRDAPVVPWEDPAEVSSG